MPKSDFIPRTDWADWGGGVMENWSNAPAKRLPNTPPLHHSITPFLVALGSLLGIEGPQDTTDLTTSKPTLAGADQTGGVVELDFDKSISDGVNIYAKRDGDADFVFLARDTASPYIDNRPLLVATKPELREYKAVYVLSDAEIGLFSDEVVVNCAP